MTKTCPSDIMNHLIDHLLSQYSIKNDAALAKLLGVHPPTISKMRHGHMPLTPAFILKVHEAFDMPIKQIKQIAHGS
jgi:plasmid maintenance system antidote protein VapI